MFAPPVADAPLMPAVDARSATIRQRVSSLTATSEIAAGVLLTLVSVYLHVTQSRAAGGLWRDEVVSVQVANLPNLGQLWRYLEFDSYPPLFHLLLRAWGGAFSWSDASLRAFGLLIGVGVLGCFWLGARVMKIQAPLFALALMGFNPMVIRYGDSVRAYGLGCALALLTLVAVWRAASAERPDWRRFALAAGVGVLSVQCLYHNAVLLFASCLGGAAVALWHHRGKVAAMVIAVGIPAALSLLPYLPTIARTRRWSVLLKFPVNPAWLWEKISNVMSAPDPRGVWLWSGLALLALGLACRTMRGKPCSVFAGVVLAAGSLTYAGFLFAVGYVTQPWYYLGFLTLAAFCLDVIFGQRSSGQGWRLFRLGMATAFAAITVTRSAETLRLRSTNLDRVASTLNAAAAPGDLVLVKRWECAITLRWYYHGSAPLMTVPPVGDGLVHRYDLVMQSMESTDPLRPVYDAVAATLRGGGRVWFVGYVQLPPPGQTLPPLPPVNVRTGQDWPFDAYLEGWQLRATGFLGAHAAREVNVDFPAAAPVSGFENQPLRVFDGWRD